MVRMCGDIKDRMDRPKSWGIGWDPRSGGIQWIYSMDPRPTDSRFPLDPLSVGSAPIAASPLCQSVPLILLWRDPT